MTDGDRALCACDRGRRPRRRGDCCLFVQPRRVGNLRAPGRVFKGMRTIAEIHSEIEGLSEQRTELWNLLSQGRNEAVRDEIKQIDERLQALWDEHRAERARIRFGERDEIVRRARAEERLERAA